MGGTQRQLTLALVCGLIPGIKLCSTNHGLPVKVTTSITDDRFGSLLRKVSCKHLSVREN